MGQVAHEVAAGPASPWWPYLSSIPFNVSSGAGTGSDDDDDGRIDLDTPFSWPAPLLAAVSGTGIAGWVEADRAEAAANWALNVEPVRSEHLPCLFRPLA